MIIIIALFGFYIVLSQLIGIVLLFIPSPTRLKVIVTLGQLLFFIGTASLVANS